MSRFRYSSSFFLASTLYALLGVSYLTLLNASKPIEKKAKEKVVKVTLIAPPIKQVVKPIVVPPKPKPKIEKPKPKKIVKKVEPKPKPKSIVKKVIPKPKPVIPEPVVEIYEELIVEEFYEEPIIQEVYTQAVVEEIYEEPMVEEVYQAPIVHAPAPIQQAVVVATPIPQVDLESKKRDFLSGIRATIHTNKKYPKMAKRRNIQGTVHVIFDIQSDGTATNIQTSGGASVLQKTVRKSIERSFPLSIPSKLMGKFPMTGVSVNVDFVLE